MVRHAFGFVLIPGPTKEDLDFVHRKLATHGARIPDDFEPTVPVFSKRVKRAEGELLVRKGKDGRRKRKPVARGRMPSEDVVHPQTMRFLDMLELPYNLMYGHQEVRRPAEYRAAEQSLGSTIGKGVEFARCV